MKLFKSCLVAMVWFSPFVTLGQVVENDTTQLPKYWDLGGKSSLTLTQTGQVNWVKGGEPSMAYIGNIELFAKYNKDKHSWENLGKFTFGQQTQGYTQDFRTSEDKIDVATKYGYKTSDKIFLTILSSFKSQFAKGYEYPDGIERVYVSSFFSPAYISASIGLDYKPNTSTSIFVSPLSTKSTFVLDTLIDETKYGLDSAATVRHEFGAFLKATNKTVLLKNVEMENSLELFSNYAHNPQNIDVLWEFKLVMSINKYLKTVFSTTLIYDNDIDIPNDVNDATAGVTKAVQFKEMLSVGFMLEF